jgi:RNA polymerase sigma-70 factor (ECF subfamily)
MIGPVGRVRAGPAASGAALSVDEVEGQRESAARLTPREADLNAVAARASAGDRAARDRFVELIRQPVLRYCRARIGPMVRLHSAEDVAQEVYIAAVEALPRYRPSDIPAMAFVYGIARNKVADALRATGRDRSDPTDEVPDTIASGIEPEAGAVRSSEIVALRAMLDLLPEAHREVLVLRVAMQFSAEETAAAVGSTPGAVRVTQHRALNKLRAMATSMHGASLQ